MIKALSNLLENPYETLLVRQPYPSVQSYAFYVFSSWVSAVSWSALVAGVGSKANFQHGLGQGVSVM